MSTYRIRRFYRDWPERNGMTVADGLTLDEAQSWCSNPETSSATATDPDLRHGPWFDGYEQEDE